MVRTQVYLTEEERAGLDDVSEATGKKQSELIREAVDRFLELEAESRRDAVLQEVAGLWRDRDDLPDFGAVRRSWDRG
ncbi:MAG: ribbon-helix-helix domain-containing protein [Spirochaetes bacterium]|nr:ribbon-helix-helix domain-containing protein [Spirochaetota bacterium]